MRRLWREERDQVKGTNTLSRMWTSYYVQEADKTDGPIRSPVALPRNLSMIFAIAFRHLPMYHILLFKSWTVIPHYTALIVQAWYLSVTAILHH